MTIIPNSTLSTFSLEDALKLANTESFDTTFRKIFHLFDHHALPETVHLAAAVGLATDGGLPPLCQDVPLWQLVPLVGDKNKEIALAAEDALRKIAAHLAVKAPFSVGIFLHSLHGLFASKAKPVQKELGLDLLLALATTGDSGATYVQLAIGRELETLVPLVFLRREGGGIGAEVVPAPWGGSFCSPKVISP